jgi:hypothetical protein
MGVSALFKPRTSVLEEAIASWIRVNEESSAEMRRSITESRRETDERIAAAVERMDKIDGKWGNRIGDLTETILVPGLRVVMNRFGHDFASLSPNRKFYIKEDGVERRLTEIDLYLENGDETMAVEVKTQMRPGHVEEHLEQLELLRKHEDITALKGKKLLGAMAGLDILVKARKLALDSGLYIIEMVEDTKYVNVGEPPSGVRGW